MVSFFPWGGGGGLKLVFVMIHVAHILMESEIMLNEKDIPGASVGDGFPANLRILMLTSLVSRQICAPGNVGHRAHWPFFESVYVMLKICYNCTVIIDFLLLLGLFFVNFYYLFCQKSKYLQDFMTPRWTMSFIGFAAQLQGLVDRSN